MYVVVAGGGLIGSEVTRRLVESGHDVVVVDIDREVCEALHAETGALTVHGSATDIRVLKDAGAAKADILVCLMRNDADNISCALLARSLEVPRLMARLRLPSYEQAYRIAGIDTVVRVADMLVDQITMEIEKPKVRRILSLGSGKAEVYAIRIPEKARVVGESVRSIAQSSAFPSEAVFMGVYRESEGDYAIPRGDFVLSAGDVVFVVTRSQFIKEAADYLTRQSRRG